MFVLTYIHDWALAVPDWKVLFKPFSMLLNTDPFCASKPLLVIRVSSMTVKHLLIFWAQQHLPVTLAFSTVMFGNWSLFQGHLCFRLKHYIWQSCYNVPYLPEPTSSQTHRMPSLWWHEFSHIHVMWIPGKTVLKIDKFCYSYSFNINPLGNTNQSYSVFIENLSHKVKLSYTQNFHFQPHTLGVIKKYCDVLSLQAVFTNISKTLLSFTGSMPLKEKNKKIKKAVLSTIS